MPAPPLEDEEALQEVEEAPQEAFPLPIGTSRPARTALSGRRVLVDRAERLIEFKPCNITCFANRRGCD